MIIRELLLWCGIKVNTIRGKHIKIYKTERNFFCECFSNSMEIFTKKCSGFTKKY